MDESGDLGFDFTKTMTSKYFAMTFVVTKDKDLFNKPIRKIFSKFDKKKIRRLGGVLHCCDLDTHQRRSVIKHITGLSYKIYTIVIDKSLWVMKEDAHVIYALIANKLLHYLYEAGYDNLNFIASRRYTTKSINQQFIEYVQQSSREKGKNITTTIELACNYKGLQIADFCSWSIFRKYEYNDTLFYDHLYPYIGGEYNFLL